MPTRKDLLTLSRADLYELVWSKPMTELAKDFGFSDVALAKRCRRLGVPVPGRGYWARVAAGQTPHRPKLSKRVETLADYGALTFDAPRDEAPPAPATPEPTEVAALRRALETLEATGSDNPRSASAPERTAVYLKRPKRVRPPSTPPLTQR